MVAYKTVPLTTTPRTTLFPLLVSLMLTGGFPPLNVQTSLTSNPLYVLTTGGLLLDLSTVSGSIKKRKCITQIQ